MVSIQFCRSVFCLLCLVISLSSCAGVMNTAPKVNGLAVAGRFDQALQILENPQKYGTNNELLLLYDKALVLHLAGRYQESIDVFEQAKLKYDQLYTQSASKIASSWLWNDYALPYRGEDFERVLINVFQALNFAALGNFDAALVEARDVDSVLNLINDQYPANQKNVYRKDAFARLLMGILYETVGNLNDAVISYRLSWQAYEQDYQKRYATATPEILKENLLAAAKKFGDRDLDQYHNAFPDVTYTSWEDKQKSGEIIVIEYQGLSPTKVSSEIPIPLPDGYIMQFSFPRYEQRFYSSMTTQIAALPDHVAIKRFNFSELGEDIGAIAVKNLEDRKVRVIAKAIARPAGKYIAQKAIENRVEHNHGDAAALAVKIVGSLYNIISERADLRSWQTLPAQIRIGRLLVEPGEYEVVVGNQNIGRVHLTAGQKKFFIVRTVR